MNMVQELPALDFEPGLASSRTCDATLEPVTIAVLVVIAVLYSFCLGISVMSIIFDYRSTIDSERNNIMKYNANKMPNLPFEASLSGGQQLEPTVGAVCAGIGVVIGIAINKAR